MTTKPEPATPPTEPTSAPDEIKALSRIVNLLEALDPACRDRIAGWVHDRYRTPAEEA